MQTFEEQDDFLVETLVKAQSSVQFLSMLKGMLKTTSEVFKEPVKGKGCYTMGDKFKDSPNRPTLHTQPCVPRNLLVHTARKHSNAQATRYDAPCIKWAKG